MAYLVLKKLWEAVNKHPNSLHVFIFPKLMMTVRGRLLLNMAGLVVYGPPGEKFWSSSIHESFVIGFIYLLIPYQHWRIRGTPKFLVLGSTLFFLLLESPGD